MQLAKGTTTPSLAARQSAAFVGRATRFISIRRSSRAAAIPDKWKESDDPLLQGCPVPKEQQPLYELKMLREDQLFEWAQLGWPQFLLKLGQVYAGFFLLVAMPVSAFTFDIHKEALQFFVSASVGSTFITTVLVLRIFLGWNHVGSRLLSATVEYEETGWYDGQVWVKTPQVLMRDRLQQMYTVKPAIQRCKQTLIGLGGALAASVVLLAATPAPDARANAGYSYQPAAELSAAAAPAAEDYEARLHRYEPWALEGDGAQPESDAAAASGVRAHMLSSIEGVSYN